MALVGMDIDAILRVAEQLRTQATELDQAMAQVDKVVSTATTSWKGPDLEQFRNRWSGQYRRVGQLTSEQLREFADLAARNAEEQRQTSNTLTGPMGGGVPAGGPGGGSSGGSGGGGLWNGVQDVSNWLVDQGWYGGLKDAVTALKVPGWAGSALNWAEKLGQLREGVFAGEGLFSKGGFLRAPTAFGDIADDLKALKFPAIASKASDLWDAVRLGDASSLGTKIFGGLNNVLGEGGKLGSLFSEGGALSALVTQGSKLASGLEVAGKALGPLGAVFSGISTINDIHDGNYARAGYDGVMTVLSTAACFTPPPVNVGLGVAAGVMGGAQLLYDNVPVIHDAANAVGSAVADGAKAVGGWLSDHNPFHW